MDVELLAEDDTSLMSKVEMSNHSGVSLLDQGLADAPTSLRLIEMAFESSSTQKDGADEGGT